MKNKCIIFAHKHNVWRNEKKTHYKLTWTCFSFLSFFILIMLNWIFFPFFPKTFGIIISNRKHKSKTDLHFRSGLSRFFWEIRFVKIRQFQIAPLQTCCLDENRMQIFLSFFFLIKLMINVYGFIIKWERKAISNADCRHNLHSKTSERQGEEEQKRGHWHTHTHQLLFPIFDRDLFSVNWICANRTRNSFEIYYQWSLAWSAQRIFLFDSTVFDRLKLTRFKWNVNVSHPMIRKENWLSTRKQEQAI